MTAVRPFTVLLVEDSEDNRELVRQVIDRLGFALVEAFDGLEGVQAAREALPDLILMDLSLPVLSGWEATTRLKADPRTAHIPIIAITAHAMDGDEQKAKNSGCDAFVTKPIRLVPLQKTAELLLAEMTVTMKRILIVDDKDDNRELLIQLLERTYELSIATNGREAIEVIERDRPDLILLDLAMPEMNGFDVLENVSASEGGPLPVIVVSAASAKEARLRALTLGAHDYITTPFYGKEVLLRIHNVLALKEAREIAELRAVQLEAHARELEATVERRTRELTAAIKALEENDRHKDEFLTVLSHELRTPLNFITGYASILDDELHGPLNTEQHRDAEKILQGADRMLVLVEDLLDIASIQAGKGKLTPLPTPYRNLLLDAVEPLRGLAEAKAIGLAIEEATSQVLWVDGPRITQVLTNLIANAIKFTPEGGQITVRADVQGAMLKTEVVDNGVGIPADSLARVFEKFQQVDMSLTRKAGGTGLGLAISKALIEAHGGAIGVESQPGVGSRFWFQLPLGLGA